MSKSNWALHVLVDAKTEYTKQLLDLLTPRIYEGIASLYGDATAMCTTQQDEQILLTFQKFLRTVPKWKDDILFTEYKRIVKKSDCEFLNDLITAVFVSHTKVLTAIKSNTEVSSTPLQLTIPSSTSFIHACYIQVAREFWRNPYLMDDSISACDQQRNMRDSYTLIDNSISESIRKQLPIRDILREYLGDTVDDDISSVASMQSVTRLVSDNIEVTQEAPPLLEEDVTLDESIDFLENVQRQIKRPDPVDTPLMPLPMLVDESVMETDPNLLSLENIPVSLEGETPIVVPEPETPIVVPEPGPSVVPEVAPPVVSHAPPIDSLEDLINKTIETVGFTDPNQPPESLGLSDSLLCLDAMPEDPVLRTSIIEESTPSSKAPWHIQKQQNLSNTSSDTHSAVDNTTIKTVTINLPPGPSTGHPNLKKPSSLRGASKFAIYD